MEEKRREYGDWGDGSVGIINITSSIYRLVTSSNPFIKY